MALYWHFPSKDALLDAMAERVAAGLHFEDARTAPWQSRLHGVLAANLAAFRAHPWLPPLVKGRIITAPAYLDILEALLDAVRLAGFGPIDGVRVAEFAMDGVAAIANTLALRDSPRRQPASPEHLAAYRQDLATAVTNHPRIMEALIPLTEDEDPERYASLALRVLVAGIEASANDNPAPSGEGAGLSL
jgi:AcrR family transcriptional regulator